MRLASSYEQLAFTSSAVFRRKRRTAFATSSPLLAVPIMLPSEIIRKARKFTERILDHQDSIREDLTLAFRHAWTLPFLILPHNSESSTKSELDWHSYNSLGDVLNVLIQAIVPANRPSYSTGTIACYPEHYTYKTAKEKWFFINGIATSPPVAILNCKELARIFDRPVHLIHTPTYGAVWDLWDSIIARTLRKDGHLSKPAYDLVKQALASHDKVVLVGHSQGTIVSSYIARKLLKDKQFRHLAPKLEIYCVAGVADSFRLDRQLSEKLGRGVPYVEHFSNGFDFFCRIGVLAYQKDTAGAIFNIENRKGHLLNDHYLAGIERGDYCGGKSRLSRYINGESPAPNYYVNPPRASLEMAS
ncbi:Hypothetical protein HDN1F_29300 [gamma proteobacterium HdN1]|nr:Hypothetical protein HDN1F_29300 [gamma proteobacterium HdN1]